MEGLLLGENGSARKLSMPKQPCEGWNETKGVQVWVQRGGVILTWSSSAIWDPSLELSEKGRISCFESGLSSISVGQVAGMQAVQC